MPDPHDTVASNLSREEVAKRQIAFAMLSRTVLVKVYADGAWSELPYHDRDREAVEACQIAEGDRRGLKAFAQRSDRPDHGFPLFQKEQNVRVGTVVEELLAAGYVYAGGHRYFDHKPGGSIGKGDVNVLAFELSRDGVVAQELPAVIRERLGRCYNNVSLWINRKVPEGASAYRLDTVNAAKSNAERGGRVLHRHGNSYRLLAAE